MTTRRTIAVLAVFGLLTVAQGARLIDTVRVGGTISRDTTWTDDATIIVVSTVTVSGGVTLTIDSSAIIKFDVVPSYPLGIVMYGDLILRGTASSPVYFTSVRDDSIGGDVRPGDPPAAPGDWRGLSYHNDVSSLVRHCVIRYGGSTVWVDPHLIEGHNISPAIDSNYLAYSAGAAIVVSYSPSSAESVPSIRDNTIQDCQYGITYSSNGNAEVTISSNKFRNCHYGISVEGGSPSVTDNEFASPNRACYPFLLKGGSPIYSGNAFYDSCIHAIRVDEPAPQSDTWRATMQGDTWPYVLASTPVIPDSVTLTIDAGTIIKFDVIAGSPLGIEIVGDLVLRGTASNPVYFTSVRDDSIGGDVHPGDPPAAPGDWRGLSYHNGPGSVVRHCVIKYGGSTVWVDPHLIEGHLVSPEIDSNYLACSAGAAVVVHYYPGSQTNVPAIDHNTIVGCRDGILYSSNGLAKVDIEHSLIKGRDVSGSCGIMCDNLDSGSVFSMDSVVGFDRGIQVINSAPAITYNALLSNAWGVETKSSANPTVHHNTLMGNKRYGLRNSDTNVALVAQYNYWGSPRGPRSRSNPDGDGDSVSGRVSYSPWLRQLPAYSDVATVAVLAPAGIVPFDTVITPRAVVRNEGTDTAIFSARMTIGTAYAESLPLTLVPGASDTLTFANWAARPRGSLVAKCSTRYANDVVPDNDAATAVVTVDSGGGAIITSITPNHGGNTGAVTVTIAGHRFGPGSRAKLSRDGEPDIVADTLLAGVQDSTRIEATLDLSGHRLGKWNLVVQDSAGASVVFYDCLAIEPSVERFWYDLVGSSPIRSRRPAIYTIRYGNSGNVNVQSAEIVLWFPKSLTVELFGPDTFPPLRMCPESLPADYGLDSAGACITMEGLRPGATGLIYAKITAPTAGRTFHLSAKSFQSFDPVTCDSSGNLRSSHDDQYAYFETWGTGRQGPPPWIWHQVVILGSRAWTLRPEYGGGTRQLMSFHPAIMHDVLAKCGWHQIGLMSGVRLLGANDVANYERELNKRTQGGGTEQQVPRDQWFKDASRKTGDCITILEVSAEDARIHAEGRKVGEGFIPDIVEPTKERMESGAPWHDHIFLWMYFTRQYAACREYMKGPTNRSPMREPTGREKMSHAATDLPVPVVNSLDPNGKCGPAGSGGRGYVFPLPSFQYVVRFENVDSATAPAETVTVTDRLSTSLDWSTVRLDSVSHPNVCSTYVDTTLGQIKWMFRGINLPPDTNPPAGEGWCRFSVSPKPDLPTGSQIRNCATVIFDQNPPMITDTALNTIDASQPASSVRALPETTLTGQFTVRWGGQDDNGGSGIRCYDVFVKTDTGSFRPWLADTSDTMATFVGVNESRYYFYSVATDNVGWRETPPDSFDARTFVNGVAPPTLLEPADTLFINDSTPTFIWSKTVGRGGTYRLQYALDSLFTQESVTVAMLTDTIFTIPNDSALRDSTYYWHVGAFGRLGAWSGYQRPLRFTVDTRAPAAPTLRLPVNGEVTRDTMPTFVWSSTADAGGLYLLQFATDSLFDSLSLFDGATVADTSYVVEGWNSLPDTTVYWHVQAYDRAGNKSAFQTRPFALTVAGRGAISGADTYYSAPRRPVPGVNLVLSGAMKDTIVTDSLGRYQFTGLLLGQRYTVTPEKRSALRERAISSYDAALALLGAIRRDTLNPGQRRAADVSGNGSVSAYDGALMMQYAVGRRRHFPVGARAGGDTVDWAFNPAMRTYETLASRQSNQNYQGILYGDPSGNWPGSLLPASGPDEADLGGPCAFFSVNMPEEELTTKAQRTPREVLRDAKGFTKPDALSQTGSSPQPFPLRGEVGGFAVNRKPSAVSRQPSAEVVFPISATGARNVLSADALVKYDTRRLKLKCIRTTDATEGFMAAATDRRGYVRVGLAGIRKLSGDLDLLELVFERVGAENPPISPIERSALGGNPPITPIPPIGGATTRYQGHGGIAMIGDQPQLGSQDHGAGAQPSRLPRFACSDTDLAAGLSTGRASAISTTESVESVKSVDSACVALAWLMLNEGQNGGVIRPTQGNAMGDQTGLPVSFFLAPPMPNPFGQGTMVRFGLPVASRVAVSVFDITGRAVRTLVNGCRAPGYYAATWDGRDDNARHLSNGVYFIRMEAGEYRSERKAMLLRN